jgi:hypothetical protein
MDITLLWDDYAIKNNNMEEIKTKKNSNSKNIENPPLIDKNEGGDCTLKLVQETTTESGNILS